MQAAQEIKQVVSGNIYYLFSFMVVVQLFSPSSFF